MKRSIVLSLMILLLAWNMYAADVNENELKTVSRGSVEFINYTGPHDYINTRQEIIDIGIRLGRPVANGSRRINNNNKYLAIHLPGAADGKIGADIIILGEGAGVDHVRNLRFILAGYIMSVYDYSFDQSFLLAEFITIYNAVYRKNMEKFESRYTNEVLAELDANKVGLSTRYNEWPGNTQIVIPLTGGAEDGGFGSIGSDDLTDDEVIDEMRSQDDMGVDSRKDMTDLQDKELQEREKDLLEDKESVEDERADLEAEKEDIAEDQKQLDRDQEQIEQDKQDLEDRQKDIDEMEDGPEKDAARDELDQDKQDIQDREDKLEQDRADLAGRQDQAEEKERDIQDRERNVNERQDELERQQEDLQDDREQIAKDEQNLEEQGRGSSKPEYALFMKADETNDSKSGQLVIIDKSSGVIEKTSGLTNLRNRMFQLVNKTVVCISGTGNNANLVLFDLDTLSIIRRSDITVYENTFLTYTGGNLYAVVKDGNSWYVGIFDKALNYVSRSDGDVDKYTAIVVSEGQVIAQRPDGQIRILTKDSFNKAE